MSVTNSPFVSFCLFVTSRYIYLVTPLTVTFNYILLSLSFYLSLSIFLSLSFYLHFHSWVWSISGYTQISRFRFRAKTESVQTIRTETVFKPFPKVDRLDFSKKFDLASELWNYLLFYRNRYTKTVWPDWTIYCSLGNFWKPVATIISPKLTTFL